MLMVDLCAGLKGASQAFINRGWEVITLDNNPGFNPDIVADVRDWAYEGPIPDLIWCSPPCEEFSREFMPWSRTGQDPDLSILLSCHRIIRQASPRFWVIENVKGALRWFKPILGRPAFICNPYYLWGNFPPIDHIRVTSRKEHITSARAAERARIPYSLSLALALAIERSIPLWTPN